METLINNYGRLIDKIRKDRKKSRQDLCDEIMSVRNFQRFANGEISISNDKIIKLIDRLNLDYFTLNQMVKGISNDDYSKLFLAHQEATAWNHDVAKKILATIDYDNLKSDYNTFLYNYVEIMITRQNKAIESDLFYQKLMKLINFPEILKYNLLNPAEMNCLILLNTKLVNQGDLRITEYLVDLLTESDYLKQSSYDKIIIVAYSSVVKGYYTLNKYQDCVKLCNIGIEYSLKMKTSTGLANLFGYKTLALAKLGNQREAIDTSIKMYMQLLIEDNPDKTKFFVATIEKQLDINIKDYIDIKKGND